MLMLIIWILITERLDIPDRIIQLDYINTMPSLTCSVNPHGIKYPTFSLIRLNFD